jgi:hypothetical protein
VYDALRTKRPYREAWETERVLAQIQSGAGPDFDAELAQSFIQMMRQWERRVAIVDDKTPLPNMSSAPLSETAAAGTPVVTEVAAAVAADTPSPGPSA